MSAGTTTPSSPRNILLRAHLNTHYSGCMTISARPPYHICIMNSRPETSECLWRPTRCLSCDAANSSPVWLVRWPSLSALYGALGLFPGSRWLPWGLMTFALMLWLWWPFREENILASQTQVVCLNNVLQLPCPLWALWLKSNWQNYEYRHLSLMQTLAKTQFRILPKNDECFLIHFWFNYSFKQKYYASEIAFSSLFSRWSSWWSQMLYFLIEVSHRFKLYKRNTLINQTVIV